MLMMLVILVLVPWEFHNKYTQFYLFLCCAQGTKVSQTIFATANFVTVIENMKVSHLDLWCWL
jgi:hypothetical protein